MVVLVTLAPIWAAAPAEEAAKGGELRGRIGALQKQPAEP
jgi:hypothetical protein